MSNFCCNFARKIEMRMKKSAIIVPEGCRRVLLHACCAPCSSAIVEWLQAHGIQPVIYYFNPNIYPEAEYEIRKAESKRHAESLGIEWLEGPYDHDAWLRDQGGEQTPRGVFRHRVARRTIRPRRMAPRHQRSGERAGAWKQMLRLFLPPPESNRRESCGVRHPLFRYDLGLVPMEEHRAGQRRRPQSLRNPNP